MAGQPLAGGWPEGTVYQARMRRSSKLDMMTREAVRVLMPPSITNGSLDSTSSTLASMSTLLSAARVCAQNFRISSPVAISASFRLQEHEMSQSPVVSLRPRSACRDGSECSERVSRCQPSPEIDVSFRRDTGPATFQVGGLTVWVEQYTLAVVVYGDDVAKLNHRRGRRHTGASATAVAESERLRGALGAIDQRGVSPTDNPVW